MRWKTAKVVPQLQDKRNNLMNIIMGRNSSAGVVVVAAAAMTVKIMTVIYDVVTSVNDDSLT